MVTSFLLGPLLRNTQYVYIFDIQSEGQISQKLLLNYNQKPAAEKYLITNALKSRWISMWQLDFETVTSWNLTKLKIVADEN